jgi:hypothetical protein
MPDMRLQIQMARVQDNVAQWLALVEDLAKTDFVEGMKAGASGIVRANPGSPIKDAAIDFVLRHLETLASINLEVAMEIALTASVATTPATAQRQASVDFIVAHLPTYMQSNASGAHSKAQFAARWAMPGSQAGRQAEALLAEMGARPMATPVNPTPAEQRRAG